MIKIIVQDVGATGVDDEEWSKIRKAMEGDSDKVIRLKGHDGQPVLIRAGHILVAFRVSDVARAKQRRGLEAH